MNLAGRRWIVGTRTLFWVCFGAFFLACSRSDPPPLSEPEVVAIARSSAAALLYPVAEMAVSVTKIDGQYQIRFGGLSDRPGVSIVFRIEDRSGVILEIIEGPDRPLRPIQDADRAILIATIKAAGLGYPVHSMDVDCFREDDTWTVYFQMGGFTMDGNVTIQIDANTGEVADVQPD